MSEANKLLVRRLVDEAQNKDNFAAVDEILAEDFVDHSPFPGLPPTREGVKMLFGYLRTVFPDLVVRIHEQVSDGEKVVTRKTFRGSHSAEFMGVPPTGRPVSFEVIDILTFRGNRISEHRVIFDRMSIAQQLA